jgi:hypothetical protein
MARRFLAPGARIADGKGYYNRPQRPISRAIPDDQATVERVASFSALCDEPEAPSKDWVDAEAELAVERNRRRLVRQHEEAREARAGVSFDNRLLDVQRRAKAKRVNVTRPLFVIGKARQSGNDRFAVAKLEALEAFLDGVTHEMAA